MTDTATTQELHDALRAAPWAYTGRSPDAGELIDWLDQQTQPVALAYLGVLLRNADRGAVCVMAEHAAYPTQVENLAARLRRALHAHRRYRLAWESARRRADQYRHTLGLVDDVPIALVLDETTSTVRWDTPDADPAADLRAAIAAAETDYLEPYPIPAEAIADAVDDTITHPRHSNDLRQPSVLTGHDAGGHPLFDQTRPWWLCHRTGLIHTEGPCILRTDPLDLRAGQGPIDLTDDVREAITTRHDRLSGLPQGRDL